MVSTKSSACLLKAVVFFSLAATSPALPRGSRSVFLDVSADRALLHGARANPLSGVFSAVKKTAKELVADTNDKLSGSGPPPTEVIELGDEQAGKKQGHHSKVKKGHHAKSKHGNADNEPWLDMDDLEAYVKGAVGETATENAKLSSNSTSELVPSGMKGSSLHSIKTGENKDEAKKTLVDALRMATNVSKQNDTQAPATPIDTCSPGAEGCKSMCWWLKMTDKDRSPSCPLFERPLITCGYGGYVPEQDRAEGQVGDPLDCAVELVRKTVSGSDVDYYVAELQSCVASLPSDVNTSCSMPLSLLRAEISDWKTEVSLKARAQIIGKELTVAIAEGKAALESMTNQEEAIDKLSNLLKTAEELPGHYLADKIRTARGYVDRLAPIPAVREELEGALSDGRDAMSQQGLFAVNAAIIWIRSAIHKAERVELGEPLPIAHHLLEDLSKLKSVLLELQDATFDGNVSLGTKSEMPQAIRGLKSALAKTAAVSAEQGISQAIQVAETVLAKLEEMEDVVEALENNTSNGQTVLTVPGYKGREELQEAVAQLNSTIHHADELDLDDRPETSSALETLDNLTYDLNARNALHAAVEHGRHVLSVNRSSPSDDAEEEAIANLKPAISWGEEVGLHNGLPVAREIMEKLEKVEDAKEQMMQALVQANASLTAKTGEEDAIRNLQIALSVYNTMDITSTAAADHQLRMLEARDDARNTLERATVMANTSLTTRTGEDDAIEALNASIVEAARVGLGADAAIANQTLEQVEEFAVVDHQLVRALARTTPEPPTTTSLAPEVADPEVGENVTFNRTGVRTAHLPDVAVAIDSSVAIDDSNDNFTEHIVTLEHAIEDGREEGVVDPQMERQVRELRSRRSAHDMMEAAISQGEAAVNNKTGIIDAIINLTTATKEAEESGLTLDVPHAEELLQQLNTIKPARDEIYEAILQANVSLRTVSGMDVALARLNAAINVCQTLELTLWIPDAMEVRDQLTNVRSAFMHLRSAVMQGEIALEAEEGEEAAITGLEQAIDEADDMDMHKHMEIAVDLMHELAHMNAEHQRMQAAITPNIPR